MSKTQLENQGFKWSELGKMYFRQNRFMKYKFCLKRAVYYFTLARDCEV